MPQDIKTIRVLLPYHLGSVNCYLIETDPGSILIDTGGSNKRTDLEQAMLAIYQGTAFDVSHVLLSVAPLIISVVMLRSTLLGKVTAYVGILANAIGLGFFVPAIGVFLSFISVVALLIWYILIARRLFQLAQGGSNEEAKQPAQAEAREARVGHSVRV